MSEELEVKNFEIPILSGSFLDLDLIDFSFKNISLINIQTDAFKEYINKYSPPDDNGNNYLMLNHIFKDIHGEFDKKYAIVPDDPIKEFRKEDIYNVWKILLIIHPSDLQIEYELFYYIEEEYIRTSGYGDNVRRYTGDFPGKPLHNSKERIPEINEFIKRVWPTLNRTDYLGLCIHHYLTSYTASHYHYQYTSLFTALDCLIGNGTELQYRLKRGIAILCGENEYNCDIIFDKVDELSQLRNDIVHGNPYLMVNVQSYLPQMMSLVSRVIIELLIHDIDQKELNNAFKRLGFGQRDRITDNWKHYELNIVANSDTNFLDLPPKVKPWKK